MFGEFGQNRDCFRTEGAELGREGTAGRDHGIKSGGLQMRRMGMSWETCAWTRAKTSDAVALGNSSGEENGDTFSPSHLGLSCRRLLLQCLRHPMTWLSHSPSGQAFFSLTPKIQQMWRLTSWISSLKHLLLLQKTQVLFPAHTQGLSSCL